MNCKAFLDFFDELVEATDSQTHIQQDVQEFYDFLREQQDSYVEKPMFTEIGLEILEYLQTCNAKSIKAKDIADGMSVSSRKISGAIRKLVTDKYVDKFGKTPVIYSLTDKGRNFDIKSYKESLSNEEQND